MHGKKKSKATWDSFLGSGAGWTQTRSAGASSGSACRKLEGTKPLCPFKSPWNTQLGSLRTTTEIMLHLLWHILKQISTWPCMNQATFSESAAALLGRKFKSLVTKKREKKISPFNTYVEETIFVHVTKHMYDISCTEGQLSLNIITTNRADDEQTVTTHSLQWKQFIMHVQVWPLCQCWGNSLAGHNQRWRPSCELPGRGSPQLQRQQSGWDLSVKWRRANCWVKWSWKLDSQMSLRIQSAHQHAAQCLCTQRHAVLSHTNAVKHGKSKK